MPITPSELKRVRRGNENIDINNLNEDSPMDDESDPKLLITANSI